MRQGQPGGGAYVVGADLVAAGPGGQRDGGLGGHQVRAQAVDVERRADRRDLAEGPVAEHDAGQPLAGSGDVRREVGVGVRVQRREGVGVGLVRQPPAYDVGPLGRVAGRRHLDGQPEPVEQLRPQLALLRVHRPDQQEPRGVPHRHPLALHVGGAERGRVEQQVDEVVVQQVDLVDVQHASVRRGEQPRLVRRHAAGQGPLEVERAGQPVLGRPDRQLHEPRRAGAGRAVRGEVRAAAVGRAGIAGEPAAVQHGDRGQQRRQRAYDGRLRGALLATYEDPADGRRDGVDDQREAQVGQAHDGGERVGRAHDGHPGRLMETFLGVRAPGWTEATGPSLWLPRDRG